ncbi:MAG: hypothetical protein WCB49_03580 [Gammaproteobacteria bacterium]
MEPTTLYGTTAPALSARAIQALTSTQVWARFAGIAMVVAALLKLVQTGFLLSHFRENLQVSHLVPAAQNGAAGMIVVFGLSMVIIYAVIGWLALRYAGRLDRIKPPWQPGSEDIVMALGAQHSYWRFQGVVIAVVLGLLMLGFILIVVSLFFAAALHR